MKRFQLPWMNVYSEAWQSDAGRRRPHLKLAAGLLACTVAVLIVSCGGGGGGGGGAGLSIAPASSLVGSSDTSGAEPLPESSTSTTDPSANPVAQTPPPSQGTGFKVGGQVRGLLGDGLALQLNGQEELAIAADGQFDFSSALFAGELFVVSIKSQPRILTRTCSLTNPSGQIVFASVANVVVDCAVPEDRFAYVATDVGLHQFTIDQATGSLLPMAIPELSLAGTPKSVVAHPTGRFAYVTKSNANSVASFLIDPGTGELTSAGPDVGTGRSPGIAVIEPTGRFLYTRNSDNTLSGFRIDATSGALTPMAPSSFPIAGGTGVFFEVDRLGKFAYVATANSVVVFAIDAASGLLTEVANVTTPSLPRALAFDPQGRFLYVALDASGLIRLMSIDPATGVPTLAADFLASGGATGFLLESSGRFGYLGTGASSSLVAYGVDQTTQALAPLQTLVLNNVPDKIATTTDGRSLYATVPTTFIPPTGPSFSIMYQFALDSATGRVSPMATPTLRLSAPGRGIALAR